MICSKCGHKNDDFQTVCSNCGEPLTPGFVMCPTCGKVLKEGNNICPRCKSVVEIRTTLKNDQEIKVAVTPKYIVKAPLSLLTSFAVMGFMGYSLIYNIVAILIKIKSNYNELDLIGIMELFVSLEVRPFVLLFLFILSAITFIKRVTINSLSTIEKLNKRLVTLKCLLLADVTAFFTYFLVSFWPTMFEKKTPIYIFGGVLGITCLIISIISLPLFYKRARVRTR